jgi:hypothetical protein
MTTHNFPRATTTTTTTTSFVSFPFHSETMAMGACQNTMAMFDIRAVGPSHPLPLNQDHRCATSGTAACHTACWRVPNLCGQSHMKCPRARLGRSRLTGWLVPLVTSRPPVNKECPALTGARHTLAFSRANGCRHQLPAAVPLVSTGTVNLRPWLTCLVSFHISGQRQFSDVIGRSLMILRRRLAPFHSPGGRY